MWRAKTPGGADYAPNESRRHSIAVNRIQLRLEMHPDSLSIELLVNFARIVLKFRQIRAKSGKGAEGFHLFK